MPKKEHLKDNEFVILIGIAVVIGIVGGYAAVLFRWLITSVQHITFPKSTGDVTLLDTLSHLSWYWKLSVPIIGMLIVSTMIEKLAKEAKGHGVPEVMGAVALKGGIIRPRVVIIKALASALSIGTGGSVGREGPIVQICSAIGSTIGQFLKVSKENIRILVGCGAAAGIAATFNAPLAGALFSVEIILRNFSTRTFSPIVVSSVFSTVVSYFYFNNEPAFIIPKYILNSNVEILFYIILGLTAGLVSVLFTSSLYRMEDYFAYNGQHYLVNALIGGTLLGVMCIWVPNVIGNGYDTIELALKGDNLWYFLLFVLIAKIFATNLTLSTGGSGGIFAPSLFIGATFGNLMGVIFSNFAFGFSIESGAYALVGMGAIVAGTTHAPITAILIIYELTRNYEIFLPLMLACILSTTVSSRYLKDSIYTLKLRRRGVNLHIHESHRILQTLQIRDIMHQDYDTLINSMPIDQVLQQITEKSDHCHYVLNEKGEFEGVITIHDIPRILSLQEETNLILAEDLINEDYLILSPDDYLVNVLPKFEYDSVEEIPVVDNNNPKKLIGVVSHKDIIETYDREILHRSMRDLRFIDPELPEDIPESVHLPASHQLRELTIPTQMAGKSLINLNLRAKFNVIVVSIKRLTHDGHGKSHEDFIIPSGDTEFQLNDRMLVVATEENLEKFYQSFH